MKRLILPKYGKEPLLLIQRDIPKLIPGYYLVRIAYAPINPSDLNYLKGNFSFRKELPTGFGFEGSGIIIDAEDKMMIGKKVGVSDPKDSPFGTYGTHLLSRIESTIIWPDDVDLRQAACWIVNPFTAFGFKTIAQQNKYKNVLLSAANSQLVRASIPYLAKHGMNVYGTVRNQKQVDELLQLGAKKIFVEEEDLSQLRKMDTFIFFDAVGGDFGKRVFQNLPLCSKFVLYGSLSTSNLPIDPYQMKFNLKSVEGFWFNFFLSELSPKQFKMGYQQVINYRNLFEVRIQKQYRLEQFKKALEEASNVGSRGKILFAMDL